MNPKAENLYSSVTAQELVASYYGISATATPLHGENDFNFHIRSANADFLLKITPSGTDPHVPDLAVSALRHLALVEPGLNVPRVIPASDGRHTIHLDKPGENGATAHLLSWIPGTLMADFHPRTPRLAARLGTFMGRLDKALESFSHSMQNRELDWDLRHADKLVDHVDNLDDPRLKSEAGAILSTATERIFPDLADCPMQTIHNDANDHNVLLHSLDPWSEKIAGLVDFGDLVYTWRVCEPAIAAAYCCLRQTDPVAAIAGLARAYHEISPLREKEIDLFYDLVRLRLAVSLVMAARRFHEAPHNAYHQISQADVRETLLKLAAINPLAARARVRKACGLPAIPESPALLAWLKKNQGDFAPVMEGLAGKIRFLDLSVDGKDARPPGGNNGSGWEILPGDGMAVGRYNEARLCYATPQFASVSGPRTVHLGMDLFDQAGTPVSAPLDGRVSIAVDNASPGDYGPTVVLTHEPQDGLLFHTLYGHLSRESISRLRPGTRVTRGETFARLGAEHENGGWPPHLHFQVITALLGNQDNFPGVASTAEREVWLDICPDPNTILNIPAEAFPPDPMPASEIISARKRLLNPALSLSYREPLTLVRGFMQFMYDRDGRRFLDAVNNVPHVGHCHPRVVEAISSQASRLNTNTRYLHPLLVTYAQRLLATLPQTLEVCFFTNSGSEANDLALRLARLATERNDMVVLDAAYHGNLGGLINISPYKFNGAGGQGKPAHTHVFPLPDPYRGEFRHHSDRTERYAEKFTAMLHQLTRAATPAAAFIAEAVPGCGGQVVMPDGFLSHAFAAIRRHGGVAIADEVQVGFGRMGDAFWGFQTQDATPDIVTMGKPMGNGHPLGAVVTTRAVADAFLTGMEYFNTYGGNPVSCAAGLAVLDVIRDENLQAHARRVGKHLKAGLRALQHRYPLLGDVRGHGLFLGIELVRDTDSLEPADLEAHYIVERMRDKGILLSVDGPLHNVIKIKPPMCFNENDAEQLVETLDTIMGETFLQVK